MLDFFRGERPWNQLLRLLTRLPRHSQYRVAIVDDDELASRYPHPPKQAGLSHPALSDWAALDEVVAVLREEMAETRYTILASTPGLTQRPQKPKRPLRPLTAMDRRERREDELKIQDIRNRVLQRG